LPLELASEDILRLIQSYPHVNADVPLHWKTGPHPVRGIRAAHHKPARGMYPALPSCILLYPV